MTKTGVNLTKPVPRDGNRCLPNELAEGDGERGNVIWVPVLPTALAGKHRLCCQGWHLELLPRGPGLESEPWIAHSPMLPNLQCLICGEDPQLSPLMFTLCSSLILYPLPMHSEMNCYLFNWSESAIGPGLHLPGDKATML